MIGLQALFAFTFLPTLSLADAIVTQPTIPMVESEDWISLVFQSMGGGKGAVALGIVLIVVKFIIKFLKSPMSKSVFARLDGTQKMTLVLGLNVVGGVIGLMVSGNVSLGAALVHSVTLANVSVFLNQIYQHYFEDKNKSKD